MNIKPFQFRLITFKCSEISQLKKKKDLFLKGTGDQDRRSRALNSRSQNYDQLAKIMLKFGVKCFILCFISIEIISGLNAPKNEGENSKSKRNSTYKRGRMGVVNIFLYKSVADLFALLVVNLFLLDKLNIKKQPLPFNQTLTRNGLMF